MMSCVCRFPPPGRVSHGEEVLKITPNVVNAEAGCAMMLVITKVKDHRFEPSEVAKGSVGGAPQKPLLVGASPTFEKSHISKGVTPARQVPVASIVTVMLVFAV
jgi:hypothetical protein